ncbi:MAG: DUF362 domain-containing protein [Sedimentisphaerales bacterium]|nr:DUF362 domain-containing protein [Sedimentisphaerales bacterium]
MSTILSSPVIAVSDGHHGYPSKPPYSPNIRYPEYLFDDNTLSDEANHAYDGVRNALRLSGLDTEHFGTKEWNPLGEIIHPGDTVVLKPNFVRDFRETMAGHDNCLITHGSIIRAAMDYVYIALAGKGRIIIADAPQNDADFNVIKQIAGLDEIRQFYKQQFDYNIEVYDLRPECAKKVNGIIVGHEQLPGDPSGYVKVNLDRHSMFAEVESLCHLLYGSEYDTSEIRSHHICGVHEYLVSKTILEADCIINLPKLKTHKKTGITICMKNLVGINGNKNWLPHHREGTPSQGGDQFADDGLMHRLERKTMICFRRLFPLLGPLRAILAKPAKAIGKGIFGDTNTDTIRSGNWYGNDTTWRMAIDLNKMLMYSSADGKIQNEPARRIFCIVDGIIGGQGNGPLDPTSNQAGVVIAGRNPIAVDLACARLMGFDYNKLPILYKAVNQETLPLFTGKYSDINCRSDNPHFNRALSELGEINFAFKPHFGWKNHIELEK